MNEIVTNRAFMYEATSAILGIMMSQNNETVGAPKQSCRGWSILFFKPSFVREICIGADHMSENNL